MTALSVRNPLPNLKFKLRFKFLLQVSYCTLMDYRKVFQLLTLLFGIAFHFPLVLIVQPTGFLELGLNFNALILQGLYFELQLLLPGLAFVDSELQLLDAILILRVPFFYRLSDSHESTLVG